MAENVENKVVTVGGLQAKHTYDEATYLKKSGDTMSGTLILTNNNDASPTSYDTTKPPALVVGGATTTAHLEIDTNEILAKSSDTAPGNLFLNDDVAGTNTDKVDVKVGISGAVDIYNTGIEPRKASTQNIGSESLPFNHMYGVNYNLYNKHNKADTDYGALRVGFTENADKTTRPTGVLELGNDSSVDSRITMYNGASFTNILPNDAISGSNKVTLPLQSGTLALSKTGSYQGYNSTGTATNPITLKLGFEANILFVWCPNETGYPYGIFFRGSNGIYHGSDGTTKVVKTTWDGNNVSWHTEEDNTLYALSGAGKAYSYMAF